MRLIDADALKEYAEEYIVAGGNGEMAVPVEFIQNAPTVDAERHGKWIERNPKKSKTCRLVECSECGDAYIVNINIPLELWARGNKSFCGNCGAKMDRGTK